MSRAVERLVALAFIAGCAAPVTAPVNMLVGVSAPIVTCHASGLLPDPACTPGATNPAVTQATIGQTICVTGWTTTVRPPTSYTNPLKVRQMAAYGVHAAPSTVEEDHLVPLELGGAPRDEHNLWPEAWAGAHLKDLVENRLHRDVCAGRVTLAAAQLAMATDWTKA